MTDKQLKLRVVDCNGKPLSYQVIDDGKDTIIKLVNFDSANNLSPQKNSEVSPYAFFSEHTPCWFSGCEELRKQYKNEIKNLGASCPSCEKGKLNRKYLELVKKCLSDS